MENYPIYEIQNFNAHLNTNDLYVNTFKNHLVSHSFIENSHSHNFYLLVLFTNGSGTHKIDFNTFTIQKGAMYLIKPGQVHSWKLSDDIDGYIMFYSKDLYNTYFGQKKIEDYTFYESSNNISEVQFSEPELDDIEAYFKLLIKENLTNNSRKTDKLLNLIDCIHIETSRKHLKENINSFNSYHQRLEDFNSLLNEYYKSEKSPSFYASELNITLKHLNRICKNVLNKTVTELINEKIVLESKRMLTFTNKSISEIANELGFTNYSYFAKIFRKKIGITPSVFKANLNIENW